jgi:uncharacterized membrane protein
MNAAVASAGENRKPYAEAALKTSARCWFLAAAAGQLMLAFTVASFYGGMALRGDWQAWNRFMGHGYVPGEGLGNLAVGVHVASAVMLLVAGVLQLLPQVRVRAPAFHRWNGRVYLLSAFTLSIAGLCMLFRGSFGSTLQHLGLTLNAVLIWICAAMALRYALARDFKTHRRWALRLFVVACGVFFTRTGVMFASALNGGPFGFDAKTFQGPFPDFMAFASYLLPLAVVELYLRTQDRPGARRRYTMAGGLALLTLATIGGVGAAAAVSWIPELKTAYDGRKSIADTLYGTVTTAGAEAAVRQYQALKQASPAGYNFDENELNNLGYELIRVGRNRDAIRMFQLNVEAYPRSGNVYDSLGEACMDAGDKDQAIANYRKSLELDPKNQNAVLTLKQLGAG